MCCCKIQLFNRAFILLVKVWFVFVIQGAYVYIPTFTVQICVPLPCWPIGDETNDDNNKSDKNDDPAVIVAT